MDETKIEKEYRFEGFGFPVTAYNAPMRLIRGEWCLDVNMNEFERDIAKELVIGEIPLTGYEVRFIRHFMRLSLEEFGRRLGVTHPAVIRWEGREDKITGMYAGTEIILRLILRRHIRSGESGDFVSLFDDLLERNKSNLWATGKSANRNTELVSVNLASASAW